MAELPLSVLDLSPVPAGGTPADALRNTLELARLAERSGYHRYWVAEHHLSPGVAAAAPAVLIALIAAATERIRVGSGAVQLTNTTPLLVAEQFGTVAQLYPDRVDLGLGRFDLAKILRKRAGGDAALVQPPSARGPDPSDPADPPDRRDRRDRMVDGLLVPTPARSRGDIRAVELLGRLLGYRPDGPEVPYGEQVAEVLALLRGSCPGVDGVPVRAVPAEGAQLQVWVLGSGAGPSAQAAGELGLPFAASYHIAPSATLESLECYRAAFRPSPVLDRPFVLVSADVLVAPDDATAAELAVPYAEWVLDIRSGRGAQPYRSPADAARRPWTDEERAAVRDRVATRFVGSPGTVVERLRTLARATGADELLVTTITHDHADRLRSHDLLARAWYGHHGRCLPSSPP